MYKAVIFDLDDTLYDYQSAHKAATERLRAFACVRLGVAKEEFDRAFSLARAETQSLLDGTGASHNRMVYCQKTLENLGRSPVDGALEMYDCYWNSMLSGMRLRDGVVSLLECLRADGVKTAVCTDLTAHIQHRKIRQLGLAPYIDVLVTSEEAGAEKPDGRIYELTLRKLRKLDGTITAGDCLFVGDDEVKDVDGPRLFGMEAVMFTDVKNLESFIYRRRCNCKDLVASGREFRC